MADTTNLIRRFRHHPPTAERVAMHEEARTYCYQLACKLAVLLPDSDERDKALDAVDLACMHANAAIARHGASEHVTENP